jgi:hypothetical protein
MTQLTLSIDKYISPHIQMIWRYLRIGIATLMLVIAIGSMIAFVRTVTLEKSIEAFQLFNSSFTSLVVFYIFYLFIRSNDLGNSINDILERIRGTNKRHDQHDH